MPSPTPSEPEFWNSRYQSGQTPWDFGGIPADLRAFLKRRPKGGRVLIPGCGSGYEIKAFAEAGYEVTAIDVAPAAVERARQFVGPVLAERVSVTDFFAQDVPATPYDAVYERTFLCAIPPSLREAYRDRIASLLKPGGFFVGYFYYERTNPDEGPPYGLAWGEGDALFSRHFLLTRDDPVSDSLPVFAGRERWQERRRTSQPLPGP
jgi:SAM-dependent methyltransferase